MKTASFFKGVGVGMALGAAAGMLATPQSRKKIMKSKAGKAIHAIGDIVENISDMI